MIFICDDNDSRLHGDGERMLKCQIAVSLTTPRIKFNAANILSLKFILIILNFL